MVTVIEWKDYDNGYHLYTAMEFTNRPEQFIKFAREALERSKQESNSESNSECIAITIYDNNGDFVNTSCFYNAKAADKWWTEQCFN